MRSLRSSIVHLAELISSDLRSQPIGHALPGGVRFHVGAQRAILVPAEICGDAVRSLASGDHVVVLLEEFGGHAWVVRLQCAAARYISSHLDRTFGRHNRKSSIET